MSRPDAADALAYAIASGKELRQMYPNRLDIDAILGDGLAATMKTDELSLGAVVFDEVHVFDPLDNMRAAFEAMKTPLPSVARVVIIEGPVRDDDFFDRWLGPPMPYSGEWDESPEPKSTRWADNPINSRNPWQKRKKGR